MSSGALEECGRQFMAEEWQTWYEWRAADKVAQLANNKEAALQQASIVATAAERF
jgi:hypothetical protein